MTQVLQGEQFHTDVEVKLGVVPDLDSTRPNTSAAARVMETSSRSTETLSVLRLHTKQRLRLDSQK